MDTKAINSVYISAIILSMGIPIQYQTIAEFILNKNINDTYKNHNIIDDLSLSFPMTGRLNVSKFNENHIIITNDNDNVYYFYNKGKDIIYIIDTDKELSDVIYNFILDKNANTEIKKQLISQLILHLFRINVTISRYDCDNEIYDIIYTTKFITYHYRLKINEEGYYSLSIIKKEERQHGITEICNKVI